MRDRRCFVQFTHPGGEHRPDVGDLKCWNCREHRRKYLKSVGRYLDGETMREGEIVFWGEWEPESRVIRRYERASPDEPRFLWEPFFEAHRDGLWRQNTDPWVFGQRFQYTGCLQHSQRGPTQMRHLTRGLVILFGSCRARTRFVIDTVFVVDDMIEHSALNWRSQLDGWISDVYRTVTIEPWYRSPLPAGQSHRLYLGATPDLPVGGMFSFFPCRPFSNSSGGFARPEIQLPGYVTRSLTQGKKIARDLSIAEIGELWGAVARQVRDQGLSLGVAAQDPGASRSGNSQGAPPQVARPCSPSFAQRTSC
jgi:hypothetical protein